METFVVYPAIDLRRGQVVRLKMGDPNQQTVYGIDAGEVAARWLEAGAGWLHVVNLDAAFEEEDSENRAALVEILRIAINYNARVQLGGGLRTIEAIRQAIDLEVARAILGTVAVQDPAVLAAALQSWGPERVAVSLDGRDGKVSVRGWKEDTALEGLELALQCRALGLKWLVYTDIARDGMGRGINLARTAQIAAASGLQVIASGGVNSLEDIQEAKASGLAGAIVGRALYDGALDAKQLFGRKGAD